MRAGKQEGFSLIELLVVLIIIGLLAAIAIPRFINQQDKANNADALSGARLALVAMESYGIEHRGYDDANEAALYAIEPTLRDAPNFQVVSATETGFELHTESDASTPVTFTAQRSGPGTLIRQCDPVGKGCNGDW